MRKDAGESGPRNDTGALLKEQNHNFAELLKICIVLCNVFTPTRKALGF